MTEEIASRRGLLKTAVFGVAAGAWTRPVEAQASLCGERTVVGSDSHRANMPKRAAIEFLDRRNVEHTHFLNRRVTPVVKHHGNPVIDSGLPWTVLPKKGGGLRMWYSTMKRVANPQRKGKQADEFTLRYAESHDGVTWTLPELGLKEENGNKANNIIILPNDVDATGRPMSGWKGVGGISVIDNELTHAPRARGRFTAIYRQKGVSLPTALCAAYSNDGLRWTAYPENPVFRPSSDTFNVLLYDTGIGRYVLYHRPMARMHAGWSRVNRLIARVESDDLIHWDRPRCVLDTDGRDAPAVRSRKDPAKRARARGRDKQFEGIGVAQYQDFYLGFARLLDETRGGWMDVRLVHSCDGIDWRREPLDEPLIPLTPDAWDCGLVATVAMGCPIPMGENLHFYYGAYNMNHNSRIMNEEKVVRQRTGLGIIPRGRLVGYHAGDDEGELLTRPFVLDKPHMMLNANAENGIVKAAVVAENGAPLDGLSQDQAEPIRNDGLDLPLRWKEHGNLNNLVGKKIRLRIAARNAGIYALSMIHAV